MAQTAHTITSSPGLTTQGAVHTVSLDAAGGNSDPIAVIANGCGLDLNNTGAGTAYWQATAGDLVAVTAGTAVWTQWDRGVIAASGTASSAVLGASFVRLVATGACTAFVRT